MPIFMRVEGALKGKSAVKLLSTSDLDTVDFSFQWKLSVKKVMVTPIISE